MPDRTGDPADDARHRYLKLDFLCTTTKWLMGVCDKEDGGNES
jgi:hypothetical protein